MRDYAEKDSATGKTRSGKKRKHEASDFASLRWAEQVERIGLNGEWNFDLADSMPDLITALPCWQESGLVLYVKSGLSNMPYGESECSIGDVRVEVSGFHYWALINGKRVSVKSDGNCFFSAVWKALRASRHVDAVRQIFGGNVPANEQDASDYFRKEIRKYALNHPELESLLLVGNNSVGDSRSKPQRSCKVRKTCPAPVPESVKTTGLGSGVDGVQEGEAARFFRNAIKNCIVQNPERFGDVSGSPAARNETDADDFFDESDVADWLVQPGTQSGPADSGAAGLHQMPRSQKKVRWRTPLVEPPPIQRACQTEFQRVLFHAGSQVSGWIAHSALIKWGYLALNTVWPMAGVVASVAAAVYQVVTVLTRRDVLGGLIQTLLALPYQLLSAEFFLFSIAKTTKQYIDDMLGLMIPEFVSDHQELVYTCVGIAALFSYFGYFARPQTVNRFIDYFFPTSKASSPNGFLFQNNVEPPQTPLGQGLVGMISKLQHVVQGYAVLQAIVNAVPRTGGDDEPVDDRGFTILSPELKARQRQERRERAEREKTDEARLARRLARTVANKGSIEGRTDALNHAADTLDNSMDGTKAPYLPNSERPAANIASDVRPMSNPPPTDLLDISTAVPTLLTLASVIASSGTAGPPSRMRPLMLAVVLMTNLGDGRVGRYISAESEPSDGLNPSNSRGNVNISELVSRAVDIDKASGDLLKGIIAHEMDNGLFYRELSNSFKPSDDNDVSPEEQLYRRAIAMAVQKYKARPPGDQTDADISAFSYFGDSILDALKESTSENIDVSETRWKIISDLVALKAFTSFSRSPDGVSKQPKNIVHLEDVLKIAERGQRDAAVHAGE